MKYYFLLVSSLLSSFIAGAQLTDLDITKALIGKPGADIETTLDSFDIDYWITEQSDGNTTVYIAYNNSVRAWSIDVHNITRVMFGVTRTVAKDVVTKIFIRYRHSNLNDLRDFHAYQVPKDTETLKYEKEQGSNLSHLKVFQY